MTVYMFPGQGEQTKGMGKEVFADFPEYVQKANAILGYDIEELCLSDPQQQLNKTEFTQPALYVVSALTYLKTIQHHSKPDFVAGHSLGEYSALFAAESFDFLTGLKLVKMRGELMGKAIGGGMLAVIGLTLTTLQSILRGHGITTINIANYNTDQQIVLSGPKEVFAEVEPLLSKKAQLCIPLNVSGAFHSQYMETAKNKFLDFIQSYQFAMPKIPTIANVTAQPYESQATVSTHLVDQITGTVRWYESMVYLLNQHESDFQQIGPGKVLIRMIDQIKKSYST